MRLFVVVPSKIASQGTHRMNYNQTLSNDINKLYSLMTQRK